MMQIAYYTLCVIVHHWLTANAAFENWCFVVLVFGSLAAAGASATVVAFVVFFVLRIHVGLEHNLEVSGSYQFFHPAL